MKEKGGEVCINRFSVNPSSLTHCDAVGGAGPAPRQTPVPTCVPLKGGKDPRQRVGGSVKAKKPIPIHPQKLPAGLPYEFQSMPPYGGDRIALKSERWSGYFNPRPHTGGGRRQTGQLEFLKFFHLFPRKAVSRFSNSRFQMLVLSVRFPLTLTGLWKLPDYRSV